jgi:7-carboxy-7-deazaguanine synthase
MSYQVKEIFYTLQGEGARTGRASVFLRFAGCNLWSGREEDRTSAICRFCDTDFVGTGGPGGGKFATADALADAVGAQWPRDSGARPYVVCTGGEPLLQLDATLVCALHAKEFEIAVETNGTITPPSDIDWICVSPKAEAALVIEKAHELKLVYPQEGAPPERYAGFACDHYFLQPMHGEAARENSVAAARYCLAHPQWRLSLQTHKLIGLP